MPIGEEYGGATYFMLETHYDNPSKDKDLVDTSGMLSISLIIMVKAIIDFPYDLTLTHLALN